VLAHQFGGTLDRLGRADDKDIGALGTRKTLNGHDRLALANVLSLFTIVMSRISGHKDPRQIVSLR